jgi:hypothetical protein
MKVVQKCFNRIITQACHEKVIHTAHIDLCFTSITGLRIFHSLDLANLCINLYADAAVSYLNNGKQTA